MPTHPRISKIAPLLLVALPAFAATQNPVTLSETLKARLEAAQTCLPAPLVDQSLGFCTGLVLSPTDLRRLFNHTMESCQQAIREKNYTVVTDAAPAGMRASDFDTFQRSPQLAVTSSTSRSVLFKKEANRIDCLHELIHVLQSTQTTDHPLAPSNRQEMSVELTRLIAQKKKDPRKPLTPEALKTILAIQKNWDEAARWLDEKEALFFIYQHCKKMSCSLADQQKAALALTRLQSYLPERFRGALADQVKEIIVTQEKLALKEAGLQWSPLPEAELTKLSALIDGSQSRRRELLAAENITAYRVKPPADAEPELPALPNDHYPLIKGGKVSKGEAGAQLLCQNAGMPIVVLASSGTELDFLRTVIHAVQSRRNAQYCEALRELPGLKTLYDRGLLQPNDYNTRSASYQAVLTIAEKEAVELLLKHPGVLEKRERGELENELARYRAKGL